MIGGDNMLFSQKFKKTCLNLIKLKNSNNSENSENLDNSQQGLLPIIAELNEELLTAVKQFDLEKVKILLDQGADPNMFDNNKVPLILLVVNMYEDAKSAELLKLLINHSRYKFNLDQQNERGETALMYLVSSSHKVQTKDQIEVLLQAGADVNVRNYKHKTVMDIAKKLRKHVTYDILKTCSNAYKVTNLLDREAFEVGAGLAKIKYRKEFLDQTFLAKKNHNHLKSLPDDIIQNIGLYLYSRSRVKLEFMDGFFRRKQKYHKLYAKKMLKAER